MPRATQSPLARAINLFLDLPVSDRKILISTLQVLEARDAANKAVRIKVVHGSKTQPAAPVAAAAPPAPVRRKRTRKPKVQAADPGPQEVVGDDSYTEPEPGDVIPE